MKIATVQLKPTVGDINANITRHIAFIELVVNAGADKSEGGLYENSQRIQLVRLSGNCVLTARPSSL